MNQCVVRGTIQLQTNAPLKNWIVVYRKQNGHLALANFATGTISYFEFAKPLEKIFTCGKYVAFNMVKTLYIINIFSKRTIFSSKNFVFGKFLTENSFCTHITNGVIQVYSIAAHTEQVKAEHTISYEGHLVDVIQAGVCIAVLHGQQVDTMFDYYHDSTLSVYWHGKKWNSTKGTNLNALQGSNNVIAYNNNNEAVLRNVHTWSANSLGGKSGQRHMAVQRGGFLVWGMNTNQLSLVNEHGEEQWQIISHDTIANLVVMDAQYFMIQNGLNWFIYNVENGKREYLVTCPDWTSGYSNGSLACAYAVNNPVSMFVDKKLRIKCDTRFQFDI